MNPRAMKVVRLRERYRIPGGASFSVGETVALVAEDAEDLVRMGHAEFVETPTVAEVAHTAMVEPVQAAVMPAPGKKDSK